MLSPGQQVRLGNCPGQQPASLVIVCPLAQVVEGIKGTSSHRDRTCAWAGGGGEVGGGGTEAGLSSSHCIPTPLGGQVVGRAGGAWHPAVAGFLQVTEPQTSGCTHSLPLLVPVRVDVNCLSVCLSACPACKLPGGRSQGPASAPRPASGPRSAGLPRRCFVNLVSNQIRRREIHFKTTCDLRRI